MLLHDYLDHWARERPEAEFGTHGKERLSYREAHATANRLANAFVGAGLRPGDRAAVLSRNSLPFVLLYLAASKAGVVLVPLNYRLSPREWLEILEDAAPRIVFCGHDLVRAVDDLRPDLVTVERFVGEDSTTRAGWEPFDAWATEPSDATPAVELPGEELYQMYTSGTTGLPKGAVLTHAAVTANLQQIAAVLPGGPGHRSLAALPMFHAAVLPTTFAAIARGGAVHVLEEFRPDEVVAVLRDGGVTVATLVPAMLQACLVSVRDAAAGTYEHLQTVYYGASPIAEETLRAAIGTFRCDFVQSYGMTEASQALTFLSPADHRRALDEDASLLLSAGRAALGTAVHVVDERGAPLPTGAVGEIVARGPQLMRGYWNRPSETAEILRDGWLHTGDVGRLDAAGYLFVEDRLKDMIVSGGENVYPRIVENVLFEHPAVADAAVIGVPDERWGETVKAVVVLRSDATVTEAQLLEFCRGRLGGFERPRSVDFVDDLPRSATGKVLKRLLREPYWTGRARAIGGS